MQTDSQMRQFQTDKTPLLADGLELTFARGLPGFENSYRFVVRERPSFAPAIFLESIDTADLCFLTVPVGILASDYSISIAGEDLRALRLDESRQPDPGREVACLAILTAPENGPLTANLLAPIVINLATQEAVQVVRADMAYSHRHVVGRLQPEASCS